MGIEQFDQLGKIGQGARQAIDLVDDNDIDPVGANVIEELLQGRAVSGSARKAAIRPRMGSLGRRSSLSNIRGSPGMGELQV